MWRVDRTASVIWVTLFVGALTFCRADEPYGRGKLEAGPRDHWSFQPLKRPTVPDGAPAAPDANWVRNPIDAFVLAELAQANLRPAGPAPKAVLLRRVYLDLVGLPPTPEELDAFVSDKSELAFERVVDRLLARPEFGQRWARHWLDVVRYAETNGYERDGTKPHAWRYRDWVIDALNDDLPYDQFVIEQLAGDEVPGSDARSQIAATMLRLGPWDDEPADPLADRYDQLDDIVAATSAAFLGLTLRCARCHDHKFEPFSQKDYTRWLAIFEPLKRPQKNRTELDRDIGPHDRVDAQHALVERLDAQRGAIERQSDTIAWQVCSQAAADGRLPLAPEPVARQLKDVPADALAALLVEPPKRNEEQKKLLARHAPQLVGLTRELAAAEQRSQLAALDAELATTRAQYPPPLAKGYVFYEEGPTAAATRVFRRGDPRTPGDEVSPGFPAVLVDRAPAPPAPTERSTGRRLQLARWLVEPEHPLTARVMINRLWQHHFGDGIVSTENDFGVMGAMPTHPELLDWLASELVAGGWRMKRMHRMMVLSSTYRMASTPQAAAEGVDPQGALLWRFRPRRIEAEALRDTILSVSGQLNSAAGGPGIYPKISRAVLETQSRPGDGWKDSPPHEAARRSVYVFVKRTLVVPELEVLDFPSTEVPCEQRMVSTVAPQALTLLNGEFIHEQAAAFADRLLREAGGDRAARIVRAYRLALSRLPTQAEFEAVVRFLEAQQAQIAADAEQPLDDAALDHKSLTAFCLVLLNTNEFAYLQ